MKSLSSALQAHLDSGATTLARCWKLQLASGEAMGFTDHDRDLVFGGLTYSAASGFTGTEMEAALGLGTANLEVAGALDDERLSEQRLAAGDFDAADIEIWLVNWQDTTQNTLLRKGTLGEVAHGELGFTVELRGLAQALNQPQGRVYQYGCDAIVGDQRCTVNLATAIFRGTGTVVAAEGNRILSVAGLGTFAASWFEGGALAWATGANAGRSGNVKAHRVTGTLAVIELWRATGSAVAAGDTFTVTAGCDRQFATCRDKFSNSANFRGFPHMPGNDFVTTFATSGDDDDA